MEMDLYLTVVISIILAILIGIIFSGLNADADRGLERSETRTDGVKGTVNPLTNLDRNNQEKNQKFEVEIIDLSKQEEKGMKKKIDDDVGKEEEEEEEMKRVRDSDFDGVQKIGEVAVERISESLVENVRGSGHLEDECRESEVGSSEGEVCGSSIEKEKGFERGSECVVKKAGKVKEDECGLSVSKEVVEDEGEKLDEWEGIERTEVEEKFRVAAAYVGGEGGEFVLPSLSGDEQMQLYGLHKVATEGPCYEVQPRALNVSARARWHAWQRLGSMNPDVAMEQYINLLSEKVSGWMEDKLKGGAEKLTPIELEAALSGARPSDFCSNIHNQLNAENERKIEGPSYKDEEIEAVV